MELKLARLAGRIAASAALAGGLAASALAQGAQQVPLPKSRPPITAAPQPETTGTIAAKPALPPSSRVQQAQSKPNPISNPFAALLGKPAPNASLTPYQRSVIERVETYLSHTQILSGQFVQVGPDGRRTQGEFHIQKPGKVRFEYDAPTPIAIIADGSSLAVRDRKLATQDIYPLSQTPLRFLLSDRIDLLKDTNVVSVTADDVFISVTIEEKQALIGTSRLMLMVGAKDGQLKQWTVTDPQGYDTTVAVYNLDANKKVDPGLFKIDFTNYATPPG